MRSAPPQGLRQDHWWRRLVSLGCGALVGIVYYGVLHWAHIDRFRTVVHVNTDFEGKVINNFLFKYFFLTQHWRHVPELIVLLIVL